MTKYIRTAVILLSSLLLLSCSKPEETTAFEPFYRFDVDSPTAWKEPLSNVRFLTEGAYSLTPLSQEKLEKYGLDPDTAPNEKGMDTLNISGSAEFSEDQFRELAAQLRELAKGKDINEKDIYVVDCRIEDHALLNGISISWYGDHNWANKGMTLEEAEKDELERFGSLVGKKRRSPRIQSRIMRRTKARRSPWKDG